MSTRTERLPWWIAAQWRSFREQRGASSDRALAGIAAGEATLRHAAAVLIAASGELPPSLAAAPNRPVTMGGWAHAVLEASRRVDEAHDAGLAALVPALVGPDRRDAEDLRAVLKPILAVRNDTMHSRETLSDANWERLSDGLTALLGALEGIVSLPVFFVDQCALREDRRYASTLVAVGPMGDDTLQDVGPRIDIPEKKAFVLFPDGTARCVEPWIQVARFQGAHHPSVRLVEHFEDGQARYVGDPTPRGFQARSSGSEPWTLIPAFADRLRDPAPQDVPRLRRVHIRREIGRGASGVVYAATSDRAGLPQQIAVKVLRAELAKPGPSRDRFLREARVLERLDVPGVIRFFGHEEDEVGRLCLLLELAEGRSVQALLDAVEDRPGADQVVGIALGVLATLDAVHAAGVVHRDIKPANLWIGKAGEVQVLDFGIATLDDEVGLTRTFDSLGTPSWAAPEQSRGGRVDARADVYAVGRLIGALLKPDAAHLGPLAVARWATAQEPEARPASAAAMSAALARARVDGAREPLVVGEVVERHRVERVFRVGDAWVAGLVDVELGRPAFAVVCSGARGDRAVEAARARPDARIVGLPRLGLSISGTRAFIVRAQDPREAVALRDALIEGAALPGARAAGAGGVTGPLAAELPDDGRASKGALPAGDAALRSPRSAVPSRPEVSAWAAFVGAASEAVGNLWAKPSSARAAPAAPPRPRASPGAAGADTADAQVSEAADGGAGSAGPAAASDAGSEASPADPAASGADARLDAPTATAFEADVAGRAGAGFDAPEVVSEPGGAAPAGAESGTPEVASAPGGAALAAGEVDAPDVAAAADAAQEAEEPEVATVLRVDGARVAAGPAEVDASTAPPVGVGSAPPGDDLAPSVGAAVVVASEPPALKATTVLLGVGVAALLGGPLLAGVAFLGAAAMSKPSRPRGAAADDPGAQPERAGAPADDPGAQPDPPGADPTPDSALAAEAGGPDRVDRGSQTKGAVKPPPRPPADAKELRARLLGTLLTGPMFAGGQAEDYPHHARVTVLTASGGSPKLMIGVLDGPPSWMQSRTFPQPRLKAILREVEPDALLIVWPGGGWCFEVRAHKLIKRNNLDFLGDRRD